MIKIGDTVKRVRDLAYTNHSYTNGDSEWVVTMLDRDGWPRDPSGCFHNPINLEIVRSGESEDELREAAIQMQVAVGKIFLNGGLEINEWWDTLVKAQQRLARATKASNEEFNKYRD